MTVILVGFFSGIGAVIRYLFGLLSCQFKHWQIPWGTYIVNISGSFLIGFLFAAHLNDDLYLQLTTGFCGGLTTFSTFNFELFTLIEKKKYRAFFEYFSLSYGIGFVACITGFLAGKIIS